MASEDNKFIARLSKVLDDVGSEAKLFEILLKFYKKMADDIMLGFFFTDKDVTNIAEQQKNFLLKSMGVKNTFSGKPPGRAHIKIPPILKGHFDRRITLLTETLKEFKLPQSSILTWIEFENHFRKSIIEEEGPLKKKV